jgi:hypothetical protein
MATNASFNKTAKTPKQAKKFTWKKGVGIFFGLIFLIIAFMWFFPYYGTIKYGICRTYIELNEPYPQSIQFVDAYEESYSNSVTISYKKIDSFGLEALNEMVCVFEMKEDGAILLKSVDINGKKRKYPQEDPELVRKFNNTIPAIRAYPPSLIMPYITSRDIKDYR